MENNDFEVDPLHLGGLAADALEQLLGGMPSEDVLALPQLKAAFGLTVPAAKQVALVQLLRAAVDAALADEELLPMVLSTIGDHDIAIGALAVKVLCHWGSTPAGLTALLQPTVVAALHSQCAGSATVLMRVSEVYLALAAHSPEAFGDIAASSALDPMFHSLDSSDPLERLAAVELVRVSVKTAAGVELLEQRGTLGSLGEVLGTIDSLDGQVLVPVILEFFAALAAIDGVDFGALLTTHGVLRCIEHAVTQCAEAEQVCTAALDAAATIAAIVGGLPVLLEGTTALFLSTLRNAIHGEGGQQFRIVAVHAVARLLAQESGSESDRTAAKLVFDALAGSSAGDLIRSTVGFARRPFEDEKAAGYHLLQSVASHSWGATALLEQSGFFDWVVNRAATTKEEREWKYSIVQRLEQRGELTDTQRDELQGWLRQGPHFRRGITGDMEVATMTA